MPTKAEITSTITKRFLLKYLYRYRDIELSTFELAAAISRNFIQSTQP
jgi:hypothetical protein